MSKYEEIIGLLPSLPRTWLITGVAGFIGVIGIDNFSTGYSHNLDEVKSLVSAEQWQRFSFIRGDIRNPQDCQTACKDVDYVLHQAALGSVPRSIADPYASNDTNISGFLNILIAARDAKVKSFT